MVDETNFARTKPAEYVALLQDWAQSFDGKRVRRKGETTLLTQEGVSAVQEAIAFVQRQVPLPPLDTAQGLHLAAADHCADQGPKGATGHDGSDGSSSDTRVARHGQWLKTMGENISYGSQTGRDVVLSLIVDDGVPGRGHRTNIFSPEFAVVGVGCGSHRGYRVMCVMDYAGGFADP